MINRAMQFVAVMGVCLAATAQAAGDADIKAIEKQLASLGDRITRLQDLTDVEIVQNAYGYYVDKGQWRSISDLFAEDAHARDRRQGRVPRKSRVFEYMNIGMGGVGRSARRMAC